MESLSNDTTDTIENIEPSPIEKITLWNGREVQAFPCNKRYESSSKHENPWRFESFPFPLKQKETIVYPNIPSEVFKCKLCDSELVDYFDGFAVNVITKEGYVDRNEHTIDKTRHVGARFFRTCGNCCNTHVDTSSFSFKGIFGEHHKEDFQKYIVHIGYTKSPNFFSTQLENALKPKDTFFNRLITFIDNFDAFQVDVNDAILAGFFRSFGIVRDSVDFFTAVGEHLKEKVGIDKETEKQLLSKEIQEEDGDWNDLLEEEDNCLEPPQKLGLSPETIYALKDVTRASPLEIFRKIFPTGDACQKACLNFLGIKHEPNAAFKRVLEEFGAAGPFGPLWMAISAAGQVAVESGLLKEKEKPFYEIALALLSHKAARIGKNTPKASEVEKLSKSLEFTIDLSKVSSGSSIEIQKASHAVEKFLDIRDLNPPKTGNITVDTAKILPTQASNVCGWRVSQNITNRTLLGDVPSWNTVRARHWKNKALDHKHGEVFEKLKYKPTPENISRMERGLAPQDYNVAKQRWESVELHHEPPQRDGGLFDFEELTVKEHMDKDPHRAGYVNQEGAPKQ
jgi:hypothetical protein